MDSALAMHMYRLFRDGRITWGRVLTLLCFGYRIAVTVIQRGIRGFFSNVVGFVVQFVFTEHIAKWIAEQGGWVRSLHSVSLCLVVYFIRFLFTGIFFRPYSRLGKVLSCRSDLSGTVGSGSRTLYRSGALPVDKPIAMTH